MDKYYEPRVMEPHTVGPSASHLIRAAGCIYDSLTNHSDTLEYDVMQFRLEAVSMSIGRVRNGLSNFDPRTYCRDCVKEAVEAMRALTVGSGRPVLLLADTGPMGTASGGLLQPEEMRHQIQRALGRQVLTTEICNKGCIGPSCYMLDEAICLMAETGVQLPGGGNSATQMTHIRRFANVTPNYTESLQLDTANKCHVFMH